METIDNLRDDMKVGGTMYEVSDDIRYWLDAIEREVSERYMELPVDRDGVPIRPGQRVYLDDKGGEVWLVGEEAVMCSDGLSYTAKALTHEKVDRLKARVMLLLEDYDACRDPDWVNIERFCFDVRKMAENGDL